MNVSSKTLNQSQSQSKELNKSKTAQVTNKNRLSDKQPKKSEQTIEEKIMAETIQTVEIGRLKGVFNLLTGPQPQDNHKEPSDTSFSAKHLIQILDKLGYEWTKQEVEQMIWEVDEDLNEKVNWYEFELMYKRCIYDKTQLEPRYFLNLSISRNLFNLVQFLMYDKGGKWRITVEDTLELLYVRHGREALDDEIEAIFGKEEKTQDGQEKEITFTEYLNKIKKRDFDRRLLLEKQRKTVKIDKEKEEQKQ